MSKLNLTADAVAEPTRIATGVAAMLVVAVAEDPVPTVIFAVPATTPASAVVHVALPVESVTTEAVYELLIVATVFSCVSNS